MRIAGSGPVIVAADTVYVHVVDDAGRWRSGPIPDSHRAELLADASGTIVDHAGYYPQVLPEA
jgi:hypothetical protein